MGDDRWYSRVERVFGSGRTCTLCLCFGEHQAIGILTYWTEWCGLTIDCRGCGAFQTFGPRKVLRVGPAPLTLGSFRPLDQHCVLTEKMNIPADPFAPALIKNALVDSGLFLGAWEMLKLSIVDKVRGFFSFTWKNGQFIPDPEYQQRVVSRSKHILDASLEWLVEVDAIAAEDVEVVHRIRHHRNDIAHDLPTYAISWGKQVDVTLLIQARELIHKLDNFWARIEFEGDPDVPEDTEFESATSLKAMLLDHMIAVVFDTRGDSDPSDAQAEP